MLDHDTISIGWYTKRKNTQRSNQGFTECLTIITPPPAFLSKHLTPPPVPLWLTRSLPTWGATPPPPRLSRCNSILPLFLSLLFLSPFRWEETGKTNRQQKQTQGKQGKERA